MLEKRFKAVLNNIKKKDRRFHTDVFFWFDYVVGYLVLRADWANRDEVRQMRLF